MMECAIQQIQVESLKDEFFALKALDAEPILDSDANPPWFSPGLGKEIRCSCFLMLTSSCASIQGPAHPVSQWREASLQLLAYGAQQASSVPGNMGLTTIS